MHLFFILSEFFKKERLRPVSCLVRQGFYHMDRFTKELDVECLFIVGLVDNVATF